MSRPPTCDTSSRSATRDRVEQVVWRRLLDECHRAAAAERKHQQRAEAEREAQRRAARIDVVGARLQQVPADDIAHDEHVAVEVHRRLRIAGRAGSERQQADVVGRRRDVLELVGPLRHEIFQRAVTVGRDARQATGGSRRFMHLSDEARFADGVIDLRALGHDAQLFGSQHRHGGHSNRAHLHHGEPACDQRRRIRPAQQDPIARYDAEVVHQHVRDAIGAFEQLEIAPVATRRIERNPRAVTFEDSLVEQRGGAIQARRIVQLRQVEAELGPLLARRQAVARESIDVRRVSVAE
jgi:hypothetical protein